MSNAVLERLAKEREQTHEMVDAVLAGAAEGDRDPTESERELLQRHRSRLAELEALITEQADVAEQVGAARDVSALIRRDTAPAAITTAAPPVGEPVYRTFGQYARDELVSRYDLIARHAGGDAARAVAQERLVRVVANTLSGDVPGIVPAQYLAEITDVIQRVRPIVANSRQVALTSGSLTYPKITQRPTVAVQATQKTELSSQKLTIAMQSLTAATYGGSGDISWQAINWASIDALTLFFDLMAEAYGIATEAAAGTAVAAATGTPIQAATEDYAGWQAAVAAAAGGVYSGSKRFANVIYASPAIAFALAGLTSTAVAVATPGVTVDIAAGGMGTFAGLRLVPSNGIAGAWVGDAQALLVAETAGAPVEMRAVEPSIGGMELGVIGAFAAVLTDPKAFVPILSVAAGGPLAAEQQAIDEKVAEAAANAAEEKAAKGNGK